MKKAILLLVAALVLPAGLQTSALAQGLAFTTKWMAAGSLRNWFASTGCEVEEGRVTNQQDGLIWPAFYKYQDMQAAKGFWIGAENFKDENGTTYPHKVAHVGPRVKGDGEFFATKFEMLARFAPTLVSVDSKPQLIDESADVDAIDPTIAADRIIINEANTVLGLKMKRTIMQFSQQYHDNYMVYDYVFTNTGNTDDDPAIELPNNTLTGVYFYFQYRYAINRDVALVIGNNPVQWGINTMNDTRGDGVKVDPPDQQFRAQYAWHGKYPAFTQYDNIGGPIWTGYWDKFDTTGRLGAAQFCGVVTLHADKSTTDSTDDPAQPRTTSYENSDDATNRNNNHLNIGQMNAEYAWMSKGHVSPRHADAVEPTGAFDDPKNDPTLGQTGGGFSSANGYGPYTIGPGESIHIVMAEAVAGLSREACSRIGVKFKRGLLTAKAKNDSVLTGRDSLFATFRRAIANYQSGYAIPQPPLPPRSFDVKSGGDKVALTWEAQAGGPNITSWNIYRSSGKMDTIYSLIYSAPGSARAYNDTAVVRGVKNFYYIQAVGDPLPAGPGLTPAGSLVSNRAYATTGGMTGEGAVLKRAAGTAMAQVRIVPNPFSVNADPDLLRFKGEPDKIAFYNIPGYCTIKIYTELGELIKEITHDDGSGDDYWNSVTSSNQVVASGVYIVVFEDTKTGERAIRKLAIIR